MLTPEQIANLPTDAKKEYLRAMLLHDEKKKDQAIRKWKNLFLPPELTRGLFSFVIEHTEGSLPKIEKINCSKKLHFF